MKRILKVILIAVLAFSLTATSLAAPTPAAAAAARTYTVWVGAENVSGGLGRDGLFPRDAAGSMWVIRCSGKQVTHEIHTVTFLAGTPEPVLIVPAPTRPGKPIDDQPAGGFPDRSGRRPV